MLVTGTFLFFVWRPCFGSYFFSRLGEPKLYISRESKHSRTAPRVRSSCCDTSLFLARGRWGRVFVLAAPVQAPRLKLRDVVRSSRMWVSFPVRFPVRVDGYHVGAARLLGKLPPTAPPLFLLIGGTHHNIPGWSHTRLYLHHSPVTLSRPPPHPLQPEAAKISHVWLHQQFPSLALHPHCGDQLLGVIVVLGKFLQNSCSSKTLAARHGTVPEKKHRAALLRRHVLIDAAATVRNLEIAPRYPTKKKEKKKEQFFRQLVREALPLPLLLLCCSTLHVVCRPASTLKGAGPAHRRSELGRTPQVYIDPRSCRVFAVVCPPPPSPPPLK